MSKPKYLKLLAVVEEDYKSISGQISESEDGVWESNHLMSIKLNDDFSLSSDPEDIEEFKDFFNKFIDMILEDARKKSNE